MAAAGKQTAKRKNRVVVWAGGGGGLLLLGGGLLAAAAALGVAFFVRAATKKRGKTQGSPQEAEQERMESNTTCNSAERAVEGEEREGILPPLPPPPQAARPPPPPEEQEDSSYKHEQTQSDGNPSGVSAPGADDPPATVDEAATAQKSDFVLVQDKIIKESSLVRYGRGEGEEDTLPAIVNKAVVVHESKIIQVVGEVPPAETAPTGGSGRKEEEREEEGSSVAEESSGDAGDSSMAEEEPHEVGRPAKGIEPTLPSLEVVQSPKRVVVAIKEEVFHGTGQKLGAEEAEMTWKESRMALQMREKGVMDKMVVEMRAKGFSRNAQVVILVSTVFFTTLLAILLHHYSSGLVESSQHV